PDAFGVEQLRDQDFSALIGEAELIAGERLRDTVSASLQHLRDWLVQHDPTLYNALAVPWRDVLEMQVALAPRLELELRLPGRRATRVPAAAHIQIRPTILALSSDEA